MNEMTRNANNIANFLKSVLKDIQRQTFFFSFKFLPINVKEIMRVCVCVCVCVCFPLSMHTNIFVCIEIFFYTYF